MLGSNFYFGSFRKYVTIFGLLFDNININRVDSSGKEQQAFKVPLTWAPKDKILVRLKEEPVIDATQPAITLPRMSFELAGTIYNGDRKLGKMSYLVNQGPDSNHVLQQYVPVAYDLIFRLNVYAKNFEDGTKIVEQILPFFCPDYTVKANLIPDINKIFDVPITLRSVQLEDNPYGNMIDRRAIIWTLDFNMQAWLWGPIFTTPFIKFVDINLKSANVYPNTSMVDINITTANSLANTVNDPSLSSLQQANNLSNTIIEQVVVYPGLTANGQPTSNASQSVAANTIWYYQNWGLIQTINLLGGDK